MPAFLTHWHVLIETARRSQDAGDDLGSLIVDAAALRRRSQGLDTPPQTSPAGAVWDTGPLPEVDYRFPGSDISAMAYLGALAPDITYYSGNNLREKMADSRPFRHNASPSRANTSMRWAHLLHTDHSGDVFLAFLESIAGVPSPALRSQGLAFAMGYLSHIAADIALNPYINMLAAVYDRAKVRGSGVFDRWGMHSYVELCLDEYIAGIYFDRPLYTWLNQPWWRYIEPAARGVASEGLLSARVLDLLTAAAEATYGLNEEESQAFLCDYRAGTLGLRRYLAGRGRFRFLIWQALMRRRRGDPIRATIAGRLQEEGAVVFEEVRVYAIRLSERLCRRAMSYYSALRKAKTGAGERSRRRALLSEDLRNWRLDTGYTTDASASHEAGRHMLHNWTYFADLWEQNAVTTGKSI